MAEATKEASLEFRWLKKRGVGGKKKEIQFYESFLYDGVCYTLYDCVYMYMEGLPEPYIGKLTKIWSQPDKTKKVKVHWFFRVEEIPKDLRDNKTLENEIFLASGEGRGLANVNPLEAIAGKCNVVCISKDSRNPQLTDEDIEMADYIFYRTFDVRSYTISDKIDDKVGDIEIKYIFNRKESENGIIIPTLKPDREEDNKNTNSCTDTENSLDKRKTMTADGNNITLMVETNMEDLVVGSKSLSGDCVCLGPSEVVATNGEIGKAIASEVDTGKSEVRLSEVPAKVEVPEMAESSIDHNVLDDRPYSKADPDTPIKSLVSKKMKREQKLTIIENDVKASVSSPTPVGKSDPKSTKDPLTSEKEMVLANDSDDMDGRIIKKARVEGPVNQIEVREKLKSNIDRDGLEDWPSKKAGSVKLIESLDDKKMKRDEKLAVHENDMKALVAHINKVQPNQKNGEVPLWSEKEMNTAKVSVDMEGRLIKTQKVDNSLKLDEDKKVPKNEQRFDNSLKLCEEKNKKSIQKFNTNSNGNNSKDLVGTSSFSEEKQKSRLLLDSPAMKKVLKKEQLDEQKRKSSLGKLPMVPGSADEEKESAYREFAVTPKPDVDKSKWFRTLPWNERMKTANEQGHLVLLLNLDPDYTSEQVEDIIWHAFKVHCTAKMVQRTAISSPHSGQSLVIFKTKEVAEMVLTKLDVDCLMLSNGRPLVGTMLPQNLSNKKSAFYGHLVLENAKTQKEEKEAVSTSHYSQSNTIEYEMAMEWCLLQLRSNEWWRTLYKRQEDELKKLQASLMRK